MYAGIRFCEETIIQILFLNDKLIYGLKFLKLYKLTDKKNRFCGFHRKIHCGIGWPLIADRSKITGRN